MSVEQRDRSEETRAPSGLATAEADRLLDRCIHCGLCLPACPTYAVFRHEMDGPRGRIALMRGVAEGRIGVEGAFTRHIDRCIGCLACVTACPSGVRYGELFELAQHAAESSRRRGPLARLGRWVVFRQLLPHPGRLRLLAMLVGWAHATGLVALARSSLAPAALRRLAELAPDPRGRPRDGSGCSIETRGAELPVEDRPPVALFAGCVQEAFLGRVNRATERTLHRAGYEVVRPAGQTCCGALALHCGDERTARKLARRNVEALEVERFEAVVTNAGGCGAMLQSYPRLLGDDPELGRRAERLASKVRDVSELLEAPRVSPAAGHFDGVVTYSDSCHLRHGQGVADPPRRLLAAVEGLELVELEHADRCCGSGAAYNLVEVATADRLLDLKLDEIRRSGARVVVSSNPGCQLQLERGVRRAGLEVEVLHLVELLDRAAQVGAHGGSQPT
ncbi:MAG: (Fe-S)-binding protein [Thermoanaerobaculia bacterium]|nr:(Fe-S)-binding protein [Thermoanaerobaculia bacterium]